MESFLIHLITASLFCLGLYASCRPNMIFHHVGYLISTKLPEWVRKVTIGCPPCMSSLWGTSYYLFFNGFEWKLILFVFCLCGLNFLATQLFQE